MLRISLFLIFWVRICWWVLVVVDSGSIWVGTCSVLVCICVSRLESILVCFCGVLVRFV